MFADVVFGEPVPWDAFAELVDQYARLDRAVRGVLAAHTRPTHRLLDEALTGLESTLLRNDGAVDVGEDVGEEGHQVVRLRHEAQGWVA